MYPCLLFDLDGTLLDSREAVIDAVAHTAERFAPGRFSRHDLVWRFGESFDDFLAAAAGEEYDRKAVMDTYLSYVRAHHNDHVRLFPRVSEELGRLRDAGFRLGVVTNKQREFAVAGLELAEIAGLFEVVVAVDDVSRGKPSGEPIEKALTLMGMEPEEALMVGDSRYDVLAAVGAGVRSVVLEWYGPQEWNYIAPDYRFADIRSFADEMLAVKAQGGE
ncbi:HAD-IA family hydrolase [Brevibacillus ruminantium]|uniref:HAD-IA family hydrolase n=1 Tax=Brevibacillus ruminantium TaxID=2950604 RepID=A0ABY4WEE1_9BACL|nr:HAD-IA family hydrolase [Brevibacillus ruminantium]USG65517.1 HAD-IA family hydrolase [Brevibacillus ruminantium]